MVRISEDLDDVAVQALCWLGRAARWVRCCQSSTYSRGVPWAVAVSGAPGYTGAAYFRGTRLPHCVSFTYLLVHRLPTLKGRKINLCPHIPSHIFAAALHSAVPCIDLYDEEQLQTSSP